MISGSVRAAMARGGVCDTRCTAGFVAGVAGFAEGVEAGVESGAAAGRVISVKPVVAREGPCEVSLSR